jgi:hypothetical protein
MKAMSKKKLYDAFLLSGTESHWDVFDRAGKWIEARTSITPDSGTMMESFEPVFVDYPAYVQSAQAVLGDSVRCITWAEHHTHASSVGHSNTVVVARLMIMDASDKDLEHVYLVDSIASGCRVQGWFMDTSNVSEELMDRYLDRHKWLSNGWPLANDHHLQVLAFRMATMRPKQVLDMLMHVTESVYMGEHQSLVAMRIQSAKPEKLIIFVTSMLAGMEDSVHIPGPQALEVIDDDELTEHATRIVALYRETFLRDITAP